MSRYDGKSVVVTGGVSGIGLATAKLLVEQGARVMVTGRTEDSLRSAREALGPNAFAVVSDTAALRDVDTLAERVKTEFGSLDALLICAGQSVFAPFDAVTEAQYDQVLAVNAKGAFFTVQKLAPLMPERSGVVFITSVANELGIPMISAYAASKAALRSMARSMARELLPKGIRVNAVSPGPIDSGVLYKTMPKEAADQTIEQMTQDNPMKRFGRPEEVGKALIFLAFEATFTTGAELVVDGGGSQL